jgi:hypothetical protein
MTTTLANIGDFQWHKAALDVAHKSHCKHNGEPEKFPCRVVSEFWDDPNGPYTYNHSFIYQQSVICDHCGSESIVWPRQAA